MSHILLVKKSAYTLNPGLDSEYYIEWAQNISKGNIIGKEPFFGAPFYPYFLAMIFYAFGKSFFTIRIFQACIDSISALLIFYLVHRILDNKYIAF
ncbi:MAG: glycosyltransferase family 39 protein, partial [Candidatus Aureabacteria bacterium]|nr:glycosyltransferase family 39 protein [Candidatus Auribacterota bacterium]